MNGPEPEAVWPPRGGHRSDVRHCKGVARVICWRLMEPIAPTLDYNERPFLVIWEVTQACGLACKHCRASAQPRRHPLELSTGEGKALIDQVADLQAPLFVFTGGDPIKRPDLFDLVRHAVGRGIHAALTPSATPLLTRDVIVRLKEMGLARLAVSLDGSRAE